MKAPHPDWIVPDWPAPAGVHAIVTTRAGGVSPPPYDSMNLGFRSGDTADNVARNRAILRDCLPGEPAWLSQVHGNVALDAAAVSGSPPADASWTRRAATPCVVMVADCMPVLLCDARGGAVAAAHAGWRGLSGGVIEAAAGGIGSPATALMAWLGPAIGPQRFEVGEDVLDAFVAHDALARHAFRPCAGRPGKWWCDLYLLARQRLAALGITRVSGGGFCTVGDARLFSHRRDRGATGRMAAAIWFD
jgi:YfiH family protein